jgi:hypothetical protein
MEPSNALVIAAAEDPVEMKYAPPPRSAERWGKHGRRGSSGRQGRE